MQIVISTLALFGYYLFLHVYYQLFQSSSFDSDLPWASFDRKIPLTKSLYKLILVCSFVFNKDGGTNHALVLIGCLFLSFYVVSHRLTDGITFNWSVHSASLAFDILITLLMLSVVIHELTEGTLTFCTLVMIGLLSLCITALFLAIQERIRVNIIAHSNPSKIQSNSKLEVYFFRLFEIIDRNDH